MAVRGLKKYFPVVQGFLLGRVDKWVKAVDDVSFDIAGGETLAVVGESGCGKTTTARMVLRLLTPTSGAILFDGEDVAALRGKMLRRYRSSVQSVFQDPYGSLDGRMKVGAIVAEPLVANRDCRLSRRAISDLVGQLLTQVGLDRDAAYSYPHEFSGGQRQRIAIARALSPRPRLIVLDEPVSALDVSLRAQIMNLLKDLQEQLGIAYLLIAHHLGTVGYMSQRVMVMYLGRIVEMAACNELFERPLHPYTQALFSADLPTHPSIQRDEIVLAGEVPSPIDVPTGCRFHPRCFVAKPYCSVVEPALTEVANGHSVACHLDT